MVVDVCIRRADGSRLRHCSLACCCAISAEKACGRQLPGSLPYSAKHCYNFCAVAVEEPWYVVLACKISTTCMCTQKEGY